MDSNSLPKFDCYTEPAALGLQWTRWLTAFELYADGKGLFMTDDVAAAVRQRRRALLLHHAGTDVQDVFATLPNTGGPVEYDTAVAALNAYFVLQVNTAFARQSFHQIAQKPGETVQQFVTRLRQAARNCAFAEDTENQIRDAVLSRCTWDYVRRKLLEEVNLTLARALEIVEQCEWVEMQMAAMKMSSTGGAEGGETVNRVYKEETFHRKKLKHRGEGKEKADQVCFRCGHGDHFAKDPACPARGQVWRKCNGEDHFAKMCK